MLVVMHLASIARNACSVGVVAGRQKVSSFTLPSSATLPLAPG
jgi:hypothetical protein